MRIQESLYTNGHGHESEVRAAVPLAASQLDHAIASAPTLEEIGRPILSPEERKDRGAIEYTTVQEAIRSWADDPHGKTTFHFISASYGIEATQVRSALEGAGFGDYLKAKDEGRMVGMVATQVLKPTNYFMTNAFAMKRLHDQGIPTALMVVEWPRDKFYKENSDKRGGFGKLEFPVGTREKRDRDGNSTGEIEVVSVNIELRPAGIRHDDGTIQRITNINDANGYRCDQILLEVIDARSPHNRGYTEILDKERTVLPNNKVIMKERVRTHAKAALGFEIPGLVDTRTTIDGEEIFNSFDTDAISMTDFYRLLWEQTIQTLRKAGELPSEEDMPMFFVDAEQAYTKLAAEANPPAIVTEIIGIHTPEAILRNIFQYSDDEIDEVMAQSDFNIDQFLASHNFKITNGLLTHGNGMMDPGSYYVLHAALPDVYFECSSCGGDKFVGKLQRAQQVRKAFGLHEKEVRIPDAEVEELEEYIVHPTGRFVDTTPIIDSEIITLNEVMRNIHRKQKNGSLTKKGAQQSLQEIAAGIKERQREIQNEYEARVRNPKAEDVMEVPLFISEPAASTYKVLFTGIKNTAQEPQVQDAIKQAKRTASLS